MMGEPCYYTQLNMTSPNKNKTLDGIFMTYKEMHHATARAVSEGREVKRTGEMSWVTIDKQATVTTDGQTTATTDGQTTATTDGQTTATTDGQMTVTDVLTTTTTTDVEEAMIMVEADPLAMDPLAVTDGRTTTATDVEEAMMAEEEKDPLAVCPSPSPVSAVAGGDFVVSHYSVVDSHLAAPIPLGWMEDDRQKMDDEDTDGVKRSVGGIARRVAGRRRAVVMDDDSDTAASVVSITSADEGSSMATSSSCVTKRKGVKRGRENVKEEGRKEEGSSEERKRKKKKEKEKKREVGKKETPEKGREESVGKQGEPKGVVAHVFEDMSSPVLGGAIREWASKIEDIRAKSKNIQGKLSGEIRKCVANIIEGAALLVVRADAAGDPQFLRMRNTELVAQLREAERENTRLQEQLRRKSPAASSPPRKKKEKVKVVAAEAVVADLVDPDDPVDPPIREEFPPLPQRSPRTREAQDGVKKKAGPRIVSDVQVVPPRKERRIVEVATPAVSGSEAEWRVAAGSRRKGRIKGDKPPPPPPPPLPIPDKGRPSGRQQQQQPKVRPPRPPASSAVTITGRAEGFSYAEAMKSAREHISLENLGITTTRVRKALNGGMLIEVSGEDSRAKAEELVTRLRSVLQDSAVVACPVKKRELSVAGFDESVTTDDILEELSRVGGCPRTDIKLGPIRTMSNGLGMVWVQLPVAAAAKAAEEGRIRVGWTMARVELLKVRPLQCFKCWSFGHMQNVCRNVVDRRGACFRCGQKGHVASTCRSPVHCAVCHDAGLEAAHRLGGPQCSAQESQGAKK